MRLQHTLIVLAVTGHAEKAGPEDGDVGISMTLQGEVHLTDLNTVIADEHTSTMIESVYDGEGRFKTNNISELALRVMHEDVAVTLKASNEQHKLKDATLDSIVLTPKLSRVIDFKARLKCYPSSDEQRGWLHKQLKKNVAFLLDGKRFKIQEQVKDERQPELGLPAAPPKGSRNGKGESARA